MHVRCPQVQANALAVAGGEAYYRNMVLGRGVTWNIRDSHFFEALQLVEEHLRWACKPGPAFRGMAGGAVSGGSQGLQAS